MDTDMIEKWNSVVNPEDVVYYMGDFSFNSKMFRHRVNGHIILVRGNHDKKKYDNLFDEVHDYLTLQIGEFKCFLSHQPIGVGDPKYWWRDYRKEAEGHDFYIVGHVHEKFLINGRNINLGVDQWKFLPVSQEILIDFMRNLKTSPNAFKADLSVDNSKE
jgi:calcineurin-like phosphoesterase family protein